ncbi:MAG TPA: FliM/FliN family flagellar motor switch protein [Ideonella sp.]|uniref:FliM/FliN family flagellar motor switch protein n=1 Tax=Ideonella sp. TaxID=1929293 RepID=UPI002D099F60|nr:FliM/FliN family flagellar motor switch protein [Ideonella sp.]HSI50177.1 FliM/FliN family flagellar motor switch protein [Ideonella sp.]
MNMNENLDLDQLLADMPEALGLDAETTPAAPAAKPKRDLSQMMRRIPITLTLEVGSARVTLQELAELGADSVIELDVLAGEPLVIKANGTPVGRAEVVVSGENYGLKVLELSALDLDGLRG